MLLGIGLLVNLIYDLIKKISFSIYKNASNQISKNTTKKIKLLIESYKFEKNQIEKIVKKEPSVFFEMLEDLYDSVFLLLFFIVIYIILTKVNLGAIAIPAFVGASISQFSRCIKSILGNLRLFEKARNFPKSIYKLDKRIELLESKII